MLLLRNSTKTTCTKCWVLNATECIKLLQQLFEKINFVESHKMFSVTKPALIQDGIINCLLIPGSNASLVCRVGSVPAADITWQKDGIEILNNSMIDNASVRGRRRFLVVNTQARHSDQTISKLILTHTQGNYIFSI